MNTSRGEVIETEALLDALQSGTLSDAVIDVWEHEPDINLKLLEKVIIGTPHIAGYSADGTTNATRISLEALCRFSRIAAGYQIVPPALEIKLISATTSAAVSLRILDSRRATDTLNNHPLLFVHSLGVFPLRREEGAYKINIG